MRRTQIAQDTLQILKQGRYQAPSGRQIDLANDLLNCVNNTHCYGPEDLAALREQVLAQPAEFSETLFDVQNETTLQGSMRLAAKQAQSRIGVLNFASAKNPGGGFLTGAQAQEESLARSSGLYPSLLQCSAYYDYHRAQRTGLYSDRMIYSPHCPVFRADDGTLLEQAYFVNVITSPAPNAGVIQQNEPENTSRIEHILRERIAKLLSLAVHHGCDRLVLGAWGCGVFRNDPIMVAEAFGEQLRLTKPFWKRFRQVLFAVLDTSHTQDIYQAFWERFAV